jgi:hypothetical protein
MKYTLITLFLSFYIITLGLSVISPDKSIRCGETEEYCNESQTCCLVSEDDYGCCPYPKATCCSDKEHCCPGGYECNLIKMSCDRKSDNKHLDFMQYNSIATIINKYD